jgi:hypothetical protein
MVDAHTRLWQFAIAASACLVFLLGATSARADFAPAVDVDNSGVAHHAWVHADTNNVIQQRSLPFIGPATPIQDMSVDGQDASEPQVAVAEDGNIYYVWTRFDGTTSRIQYRRDEGGTLGPVINLSTAGGNAGTPQVAVDPADHVYFVWVRDNGAESRVQVRRQASNGTLGPILNLTPAGKDGFDPQVAAGGPAEGAYITWTLHNRNNSLNKIQASYYDGTAFTPTPAEDLSGQSIIARNPQAVVDPEGDVFYAWEFFNGANYKVQIRRRDSVTQGLDATQVVSPAGQDATDPQLAADESSVYVTWYRESGGLDPRIQFRTLDTTTVPATPLDTKNLSTGGASFAEAPQVAAAVNDQDVYFVWTRGNGINARVQARYYDAFNDDLYPIYNLSASGANADSPQVSVYPTAVRADFVWESDGVIQASRMPFGSAPTAAVDLSESD